MSKSLKKHRKIIKRERPYIYNNPYSRDIINITLQIIANDFGIEEANKAIKDFKLKELGWREFA